MKIAKFDTKITYFIKYVAKVENANGEKRSGVDDNDQRKMCFSLKLGHYNVQLTTGCIGKDLPSSLKSSPLPTI